MRLPLVLIAATLTVSAPVLAQDLTVEEQATNANVVIGDTAQAPTAWLGAEPHFVMVGTYGDYTFNINLADLSSADAELAAKREYGPAGDGLAYIDFEIALNLVTEGIERSLEMEFENADFSAHQLPADFAIQNEEEFPEGERAAVEFQFEWEWVEKSVVVNEEFLYEDGVLTLALEEGTPDDRGVAANGMIGGFATATIDGQDLAVSFTAPVVEAEIDD